MPWPGPQQGNSAALAGRLQAAEAEAMAIKQRIAAAQTAGQDECRRAPSVAASKDGMGAFTGSGRTFA